jgi:hypothetical protein
MRATRSGCTGSPSGAVSADDPVLSTADACRLHAVIRRCEPRNQIGEDMQAIKQRRDLGVALYPSCASAGHSERWRGNGVFAAAGDPHCVRPAPVAFGGKGPPKLWIDEQHHAEPSLVDVASCTSNYRLGGHGVRTTACCPGSTLMTAAAQTTCRFHTQVRHFLSRQGQHDALLLYSLSSAVCMAEGEGERMRCCIEAGCRQLMAHPMVLLGACWRKGGSEVSLVWPWWRGEQRLQGDKPGGQALQTSIIDAHHPSHGAGWGRVTRKTCIRPAGGLWRCGGRAGDLGRGCFGVNSTEFSLPLRLLEPTYQRARPRAPSAPTLWDHCRLCVCVWTHHHLKVSRARRIGTSSSPSLPACIWTLAIHPSPAQRSLACRRYHVPT